jgi:hypothetical protein
MDTGTSVGPTNQEKKRYLKKIQEWRRVGFNTAELEYLLEHDFDEFLRKRHEILKYQVKSDKELEAAYLASEDEMFHEEPEESLTDSDLLDSDSFPMDDFGDTGRHEEDLLLLGEPLPPEEESLLEPEDESVIFVGKFQPPQKSKVHRSRRTEPKRSRATKYDNDEIDQDDFVEDSRRSRSKKELETEEEDIKDDEYGYKGTVDSDEEDEYENIVDEEKYDEEEYDEEYDEDYNEEEEYAEKPAGRARSPKQVRDDEEQGSAAGKILAAIVIMIVILASFYFIGNLSFDFGTQSSEKVKAEFELRPERSVFEPGKLITLDASASEGDKLKFKWILGDDFEVHEGSLSSKALNGYYIATENEETKKTIMLEVSGKEKKDVKSMEITIKPRSFEISPEKIGDNGEYKVTGYLEVSNSKGITNYEYEDDEEGFNADVKVTNVRIDFETKDSDPMTMDLSSVDDIQDGFLQEHSTFLRTMEQNLGLTGTVTGIAEVKEFGRIEFPGIEYPVNAGIEGTMSTVDKSYTDLETLNTIYGSITNNMEITMDTQLQGKSGSGEEMSFSSNDRIESYPFLQNNPGNLRIIDLSADGLSIGDQSGIFANNINYIWNAQKVEYIYDQPAIKVNLTIDEQTRLDMNLKSFYFAIWVAENISLPVKSHLYAVQLYNQNTTRIKYVTEMASFFSGNTLISSLDCDSSTPDGHFYDRHPDYKFEPKNNWSYLPPTGSSIKTSNSTTSFDPFTQEQALTIASQDLEVHNYLNNNPSAYVVSGHCTAKEDTSANIPEGTLHWNLTFGKKNVKKGFNVIVTKDGNVISKNVEVDPPPNSTGDFDPLLTFAGAEDIFNNNDLDFYSIVFDSNSRIDFDNIEFGVITNLQYPNVDITSIIFVERSKYAYQINYEEQSEDGENKFIRAAVDTETGQLLFYLNHKDDGFSIF